MLVVIFSWLFGLILGHSPVHAAVLSFHQLDWIGISSSTPDSAWGRVTVNFTGYSNTAYLNLNVNGQWAVQNMGISSLYGAGVNQTVSTTFDLGVTAGTDVSNLNYYYEISSAPMLAAPSGPIVNTFVNGLAYQIGGEGGIDLGSPGAPGIPTGGNAATVTMSGGIPNIVQFVNQPQGMYECVPGAISNSLKYLQATGQLTPSLPSDISDIKPIVQWASDGSPTNWYKLKADHYKDTLTTTILAPDNIMDLINALNAGKDVELDLDGHVAVVAGVRKYSDGRIELDIFDDNQKDNISDPLRTVEIRNGKVDGQTLERFVVESAVPEPSMMVIATVLGIGGYIGKRRMKK